MNDTNQLEDKLKARAKSRLRADVSEAMKPLSNFMGANRYKVNGEKVGFPNSQTTIDMMAVREALEKHLNQSLLAFYETNEVSNFLRTVDGLQEQVDELYGAIEQ